MDERLAARIEQARRELRIAEGVASEQELRDAALDQQMERFRDQVHASLDASAAYLLGTEFARDEEGMLARMTASGEGFELRPSDGQDLILKESNSKRVLLLILAGDSQAANRILCAMADRLAVVEPSA